MNWRRRYAPHSSTENRLSTWKPTLHDSSELDNPNRSQEPKKKSLMECTLFSLLSLVFVHNLQKILEYISPLGGVIHLRVKLDSEHLHLLMPHRLNSAVI